MNAVSTRARCFVCFRPVPAYRRSLDEVKEPSTCSSACEVRNLRNRGAIQVIRNARNAKGEPVVATPVGPPCAWCRAPLTSAQSRWCSQRCRHRFNYMQLRQRDEERKSEAPASDGWGTFDPSVVATVIARGPSPRDCPHTAGWLFDDVCKGCLLGRLEVEAIAKAREAS